MIYDAKITRNETTAKEIAKYLHPHIHKYLDIQIHEHSRIVGYTRISWGITPKQTPLLSKMKRWGERHTNRPNREGTQQESKQQGRRKVNDKDAERRREQNGKVGRTKLKHTIPP